MKDFYSIIRLSPNPNADDVLSVGLVVFTGGSYFFRTSDRKIRVAKQLYRGTSKNIDWYLDLVRTQLKNPDENIGESLFEYVSRYSNGVLRFDPPRKLNVSTGETEFNKLFHLLVDDHTMKAVIEEEKPVRKYSKAEFRNQVRERIINPLKGQVNTKITFPKDHFREVYFSLELDCLGKNGSVYAAKSFDFENVSASTHDRHIGHYFILASVLNEKIKAKGKENHFFIVADEPTDIGSEVHQQWEAVKKMPLIEVVPLESANIISDTILNARAKPLF